MVTASWVQDSPLLLPFPAWWSGEEHSIEIAPLCTAGPTGVDPVTGEPVHGWALTAIDLQTRSGVALALYEAEPSAWMVERFVRSLVPTAVLSLFFTDLGMVSESLADHLRTVGAAWVEGGVTPDENDPVEALSQQIGDHDLTPSAAAFALGDRAFAALYGGSATQSADVRVRRLMGRLRKERIGRAQ